MGKNLTSRVQVAAATAVVIATAVVAGIAAAPSDAAITTSSCQPLYMTYSSFNTYKRCYFEGDFWSNGWHLYTRGYNDWNCSAGGCTLMAGGRQTQWYASGGQWVFWRCRISTAPTGKSRPAKTRLPIRCAKEACRASFRV